MTETLKHPILQRKISIVKKQARNGWEFEANTVCDLDADIEDKSKSG